MRILRVAGMLFGLAAALVGALPAVADGNGPTVDLSVGWGADSSGGGTAAPSSWLPFTALISIPSGRSEWTGTLVIRPKAPPNDAPGGSLGRGLGSGFNAGAGGGPIYQEAVTVRPDAPKTVVVYGQYAVENAAAYEAVLTDSRGVAIAISSTATLRANYVTIGILSDAPSADSLFRGVVFGAPPQSPQVRGHHFDKVENVPSNALALSGFHAIVIDDFDSSTLSQAQARALQDYVGFGGSLILAGGTGWRRSLAQLPGALLPLRPDSTGTASLGAVMEVIGRTSDLSVPVAMGTLATGARVVLADGTGIPLVAESSYGSGRIVELTYDPALDPVFGTDVATQGWTQVINRAVSPARSNSGYPTGPVPAPIGTPGAPPISGATGYGSGTVVGVAAQSSQPTAYQLAPVPTSRFAGGFEPQVFDMLANSPASALPPLGLLGAILVGYVILAGPANYLWARGRRRRELTWVTVPLIAVIFTGIAYGAGIAYRGSDFLVNELQILRVAPNGSVDATLLDVLFAPRRGDFIVQAPDGSYTTIPGQVSPVGGATPDHVNPGRHPTLALNDLHVWGQRNFKIEVPLRSAMSLETHLGISELRVKGSITNRGIQPIRDLALLTVSGEWAALAGSLAPGATVVVDSPLGRIPEYSNDTPAGCRTNVCVAPPCAGVSQPACRGTVATPAGTSAGGGSPLNDAARKTLAEVAAGASVMSRSDIQAVVGTVDPMPGITIGDRSPNRRSVAAVAEAVRLETIDVLPGGWAGARLVTNLSNGSAGKSLSVWDFDLPARVAGSLVLQYGTPGLGGTIKGGPVVSPPTEVEVYDWSARNWSRLTYDVRCPGASTFCATLSTGQSANGLVRIRTKNGAFYNFQMQLLSAGGARS